MRVLCLLRHSERQDHNREGQRLPRPFVALGIAALPWSAKPYSVTHCPAPKSPLFHCSSRRVDVTKL